MKHDWQRLAGLMSLGSLPVARNLRWLILSSLAVGAKTAGVADPVGLDTFDYEDY